MVRNEDISHAGLSAGRLTAIGVASGVVGGLAMAGPIVIWDLVRSSHRALELPMAATSWPFGLVHFSHDRNLWWPIVLGTLLLAAFWAVSGVAFAGLADRAYRLSHAGSLVAAGAAWSFANFIFFWNMLLPIARDGAPFRPNVDDPQLFAAPNWVWILGFTLSGLVIAVCYTAWRRSPAFRSEERRVERVDEPRTRLRHAA
jgi:hypothetical protein